MKITKIQATPMRVPYKRPYHWSQGIIEAAETVLIAIHAGDGLVGYGEVMMAGAPDATLSFCKAASELCLGRDPSRINSLLAELHQKLFASCGNLGGRRFGATLLAGFDMALWDLAGKAAGKPVHALLGGAVRDEISYFGFPQGETADEVAQDARAWAEHGSEVIYFKVGRGAELDIQTVRKVRAAIGDRRLRLDANEVWDVLTARRMIRAFEPFGIEFLEQPTPRASLCAMKAVREASAIPIAADQSVYSAEDVLAVCQAGAADMVVVGLHEAGGMTGLLKCAAVAQAAGMNLCLHGLYETGIGTCATLQAGAVIPNLDDGNQIMHHFLVEDVVSGSGLTLQRGRLPILQGPGLGFALDWDAVARAEERFRSARS